MSRKRHALADPQIPAAAATPGLTKQVLAPPVIDQRRASEPWMFSRGGMQSAFLGSDERRHSAPVIAAFDDASSYDSAAQSSGTLPSYYSDSRWSDSGAGRPSAGAAAEDDAAAAALLDAADVGPGYATAAAPDLNMFDADGSWLRTL
jgi:hypothetical protein